jgi:hypothetical protein
MNCFNHGQISFPNCVVSIICEPSHILDGLSSHGFGLTTASISLPQALCPVWWGKILVELTYLVNLLLIPDPLV